ncbi:MAG TPA: rhodanese-like domain-containing protein [Euzebya sp.]|nr:rhodanese-like domain-containing protein [Euzebya sp.]
MDVLGLRTPGLGDTTFLVHHEGIGVLVDPQRDVGRFLDAAEQADVVLRLVLETHLHNDYLSGGRQAARLAGAGLVVPAGAGAAFRHVPAFHHEELTAGALTVRPIHTPGHTPEHVSYLVLVEDEPAALFSGGSLLVGSAGRTDLLGPERARQLARLQFASLRRLAALPDHVALYPTHGAGSFCAAGTTRRQTSTIGHERATNPLLQHRDEDHFVEAQRAALQPYPRYYAHMGRQNLLGAPPLPDLSVPELTVERARALWPTVEVVDARSRGAYAAGHIPGALGVELGEDFGIWVGWLVPYDASLLLVLDRGQDIGDALLQMARIGVDRVAGVLWGVQGWRLAGHPVTSHSTASARELTTARQVLDVRSPAERDIAHLPGSVHRYLPDLVDAPPPLDPSHPLHVACATGRRASIAAGLLERHGYRPIVVTDGGIPDIVGARTRPQRAAPSSART